MSELTFFLSGLAIGISLANIASTWLWRERIWKRR